MSNFYVALLLAGLYTLAQCQNDPAYYEEEIHPTHSAENLGFLPYSKIVQGNADFAFRLFKVVTSATAQNNTFFSPLGISISFAMLSLGMKGSTRSQVLTGLGFNKTDIRAKEIHVAFRHLLRMLNNPRNGIELNIGGTLFVDEKLKPIKRFLANAHHFYKADISHANFAHPEEAEHQINSYIDKKTHGKLVDVIKGLDPNSVMVLLNYVFLKANWENPFDHRSTREDDFIVDEHTTVKVPMMNRDGFFNYYRDIDLSCQVVQLPYKGSASAIFILPDPGKMKQLENALNIDVLLKWLNLMKPWRTHLYLPRFSVSETYVLKGLMRKLGIVDIFNVKADLSGISSLTKMKITKAIHHAYLDVHENGTEAATVTLIELVPTSFPPVFRLNHPFLLIIYDNITNTILFMGKIKNPKEN